MSDALERARAEATQELATAISRTISAHAAAHGINDPELGAMVGSALTLVIVEAGQKADPLLPFIIIKNLGGEVPHAEEG